MRILSAVCPSCGQPNQALAVYCTESGALLVDGREAVADEETDQEHAEYDVAPSLGAHVVNLLACLMLVIGPFLPWATAGIFSVSGMQKTGNEAIILMLLGLAGIAVSVVSLAGRRNRFTWALFVVGGVCLILSVYYYVQLRGQLSEVGNGNEILPVSMGAGIYVCIVASIVVLLGAFAGALRRR